MAKPKKIKPLFMQKQINSKQLNADANANNNAYINANPLGNETITRFQQNQPVVDRLPLVEENTLIIPANEIVQMNYKDCNSSVYKDHVEQELYTTDLPLFTQHGPVNLVPLDINDSTHRRVNFY
jgi:hypothetical protein